MNKFVSGNSFIILFFLFWNSAYSQDLNVIVHRTHIDSLVGCDMVFEIDIINISQYPQTIFAARTINDLPPNWQSALCFGNNCFPPYIDSAATTDPVNPGDTLKTPLHITAIQNEGTGTVQLQFGTTRNQFNRYTYDFTATATLTSVEGENTIVDRYYIEQNYPNPFNPSTNINFGLKKASEVEITVYNILGNKVATLLNGYKSAGNYSVTFNASNLSSGVYFYKITTTDFIQTKKMILEK